MINTYIVGLLGVNLGVLPLILIILACVVVGVGVGILTYRTIVIKKINNANNHA